MKIRNSEGFTFIEVIVGLLILSIASVGMMLGVSYARAQMRSLEIRERALQELVSHMEYWQGRIADGNFSSHDLIHTNNQEVVLYEYTDGSKPVIGTISIESHEQLRNEIYSFIPYYEIEFKIEWRDYAIPSENPHSLTMKADFGELYF